MVALRGVLSLFKKFFAKEVIKREGAKDILEELMSGISMGTFMGPAGAGAGGAGAGVGMGAGGIFIQAQAISRALERIPLLGTLAKPIFEITTTLQALNRVFLRLDSKTGRMETLLTHVLEMFQTAMHLFFFPIATALGALLLPLARIFLWIGLLFVKSIYPHLRPLLEWGMRKGAWDKLVKGEELTEKDWQEILLSFFVSPFFAPFLVDALEKEKQKQNQRPEGQKEKEWWEHILDFLTGKWFPEAHATSGVTGSAETTGAINNIVEQIMKSIEAGLHYLERLPVTVYSLMVNAIIKGIPNLQKLPVVTYSLMTEEIIKGIKILQQFPVTIYRLMFGQIREKIYVMDKFPTRVYSYMLTHIIKGIHILEVFPTIVYSFMVGRIDRNISILGRLPTTVYSLMTSEIIKELNILREFGSWLLSEIKRNIVVERYVISIPTISYGGGGGGGITYTSSRGTGSGSSPMPSGPYRTASYAMQHGGLITEPIYGLGLVSGKTYLLGEAGPERVTPLNRRGGSGNIVVNIHIAGSVYGINDLKRIIDDAVAEVTKRRLSL